MLTFILPSRIHHVDVYGLNSFERPHGRVYGMRTVRLFLFMSMVFSKDIRDERDNHNSAANWRVLSIPLRYKINKMRS